MPFLVSLLFFTGYQIVGDEPNAWPNILSSIGLSPGSGNIIVIPAGTQAPVGVWMKKIEEGSLVILEGSSPLAEELGIHATAKKIQAKQAIDAGLGRKVVGNHAETDRMAAQRRETVEHQAGDSGLAEPCHEGDAVR